MNNRKTHTHTNKKDEDDESGQTEPKGMMGKINNPDQLKTAEIKGQVEENHQDNSKSPQEIDEHIALFSVLGVLLDGHF